MKKKGATKKKRNRKLDPNLQQKLAEAIGKLDPKLQQKLTRRIRKLDPELVKQLTERITPSGPPKPKVTPRFRARTLAFIASHSLPAFAGHIHNGALADDKLFIKYLGEFVAKKPIRLPISEQESKLLQLLFRKPYLNSSEALKELPFLRSKAHYRALKRRALKRLELMREVWRRGWLNQA